MAKLKYKDSNGEWRPVAPSQKEFDDLKQELNLHKQDYLEQRSQDQLKIAKVEKNINDFKNTINKININQEPKQTVSGYGTILLPKSCAEGQINEISIFGNTEAEEDNVKSTLGAIRLKSVGKNLFDGKWLPVGTRYSASALTPFRKENLENSSGILKPIKIQQGKSYSVSCTGAMLDGIYWYDENGYYINRVFSYVNITPPNNAKYMTINIRDITNIENVKLQIEVNNTTTEFEDYKESTLYVIAKDEEGNILELRSLPNGTKDEVNISERKLIKRIEVKSNITSGTIINFTDMAEGGTYYAWNENGETETGTKGDTLGIDATTLIYQLATPIEIPIEVVGTLLSYPSGTVYVENVVADAGVYNDGITVLHQDLPIKQIESLYKVDFQTGLEYPLDISQCIISQDKLSFTHPELQNNDIVFFAYEYDVESTKGLVEMEHYDSRYVVKDDVTGKFYKWNIKVSNGVPSIVLEEV